MKKLKYIISVVGIFAIFGGVIAALILFGGQKKSNRVVVTIFPIYEIATEILGSDDEITLLQDSGVDLHSYEATAKDIVTISNCELFIFIGGHSDNWIGDVIRSANNVNLKTLELISCVKTLEDSDENIVQPSPNHTHDEHYDHDHDDHNHADEHIWMSLKNMVSMTHAVLDNLLLVYPEREVILKDNAESYINKLESLHERYQNEIAGATKSLLIADRFPFRYLTFDYGIGYHAAFSGCSAETEASPSTITSLIETLNNAQLHHVLVLETSDKKLAETIIDGCNHPHNIEILVIHSCQGVTKKDLGKLSYLDIMENNLENIKKALY